MNSDVYVKYVIPNYLIQISNFQITYNENVI